MSLSNIGPIVSIQQGNNVFLYGTPYRIRTGDLRRERAASLTARRTGQKIFSNLLKNFAVFQRMSLLYANAELLSSVLFCWLRSSV